MNENSKKRYSRQRECIIDFLKNTDTHPTANMIYDKVREEIPNISLGTVYRNLSELTNLGEIIKIESGDAAERYDMRIVPHSHFVCKICGEISDLFLECDKELDLTAEMVSGCEVDSHQLVFNGVCYKCIEKQ